MSEEPKTIEQFETTLGDHWAMIDLELVADNTPFKACLEQGSAHAEVADKTFARVGMLRAGGVGTLVTREEFQPFFDAYGQVMLDETEWAAYLAENAPAEEEVV